MDESTSSPAVSGMRRKHHLLGVHSGLLTQAHLGAAHRLPWDDKSEPRISIAFNVELVDPEWTKSQLADPSTSKAPNQKWVKLMGGDTYSGWSKKQKALRLDWDNDVLIRYYYNMRAVIEAYGDVDEAGVSTDHGSTI